MTGLCGAIGDSEKGVASAIDVMLKTMSIRGSNARSFTFSEGGKHVGIGICDWNQESSKTNPLARRDLAVATDGFFYQDEIRVKRLLGSSTLNSLTELLRVPGAFSIVAVRDGKLLGGRDPVGQKPLYYGTDSRGRMVTATLRSSLSAVSVKNVQPVPPGALLESAGKDWTMWKEQALAYPSEQNTPGARAVATVGKLLEEAVSRGIPSKSAIAFSGGLDSSLVAAACKRNGETPELVTVGVQGQPELEHAHRMAVEMGLPITVYELSPSEIISRLPDVVALIESTNPVAVGVSVAFYFACEKAREIGLTMIAAGQMSDELFGGYARFEDLALRGQTAQLRSEILESVNAAPSNDFEPGDKVAVSFRLELRCPFAYLPLVTYALRLPLSMKVRLSSVGPVRKYVLRELASRWKLPEHVVNRPKQAVQYSSGVQKVLRREAKRRRTSLGALLESLRQS